LAEQLGQPLTLDYRPRLPRTTELELVSRQDYPGGAGEPAAILRFSGPRPAGSTACAGARCRALPPATCWACWRRAAPCRACILLASGWRDGFVEICVRRRAGVCSGYLHGLQPGARIAAFIRPNPPSRWKPRAGR
jgi:sulfite reductase (NADPH) flavoprotein alpha-component